MKNLLFYHLKRGKLAFLGKPMFSLLVRLELFIERVLDVFLTQKKQTDFVNSHLTAVIKTFERPKALKRLVRSIRRFYPKMQIIVVDDSRRPTVIDNVKTVVMPYDTGISAGRNRALKEVQTKYMLLLDDDFVFFRKTNLQNALRVMEKNDDIDIMGGSVVDLPLYRVYDYRKSSLYVEQDIKQEKDIHNISELPVYDKVANFFIARPERLEIVGWDERLKKIEHTDFFTRAKGVLITVYNHNFSVLHAQTLFNKLYMEKRYDISDEQDVIHKKYFAEIAMLKDEE